MYMINTEKWSSVTNNMATAANCVSLYDLRGITRNLLNEI